MAVVQIIDTLTDWARENVCDKIKLKVPPLPDEPDDAGYEYKLVNPAAFGMYTPTSEKVPPNVHAPFPSLCVRLLKGQENPAQREGFIDVQFCFSTWDTGLHGKDIIQPMGNGVYRRWTGAEANAFFERNGEGWRDAWNFVDIALRELESVSSIGGYVLDLGTPIEFGPLTEQESIPDFYPFWFAWVSFRIKYPLRRNVEEIQNYL